MTPPRDLGRLPMSNSPHAPLARPALRVEDATLLRGRGRFVDDIALPGLLHASFVRSPVAHARLNGIDVGAARALPGVRAVFTYRDLRPVIGYDRIPLALPVAAIRHHVDPSWLAEKELCFAGEPVAVVVAESRAIAEDAANLVVLDYEELPAVIDPVAALAPGAPQARLDCADNLVAQWSLKYGDAERAFASAAHRIAQRFRIHKGGGHAIEARAVLARFDATEELLTVWDGTQMPHKAKRVIVDSLGFAESQVRVIAPHVGGGFGPKNPFYPEELVVPAAACCSARRSNGSRTGAKASPPPITSASRIGTSKPRSMPTAGCSRCAAGSITTTARRRRPACRRRRIPAPISSVPMCCRRSISTSRPA